MPVPSGYTPPEGVFLLVKIITLEAGWRSYERFDVRTSTY
jgi:hypothetical protein